MSDGLIVRGLERRSGILRFGSHEISKPSEMPGPAAEILYYTYFFSKSNLTQASHLS